MQKKKSLQIKNLRIPFFVLFHITIISVWFMDLKEIFAFHPDNTLAPLAIRLLATLTVISLAILLQITLKKKELLLIKTVTERDAAFRKLHDRESRIHQFYDETPALLLEVDNRHAIRYANEGFLIATGYKREEIEGAALSEFMKPEELLPNKEGLNNIFLHRTSHTFEAHFKSRNGHYRLYSGMAAVRPRDDQRSNLVLLIATDITEQRKQKTILKREEKLNSLGKLAGGVAHYFNSQLMGVLGYTSLMKHNVEDTKIRSYIDKVRSSALQSAELTQKLLSFSHTEVMERKKIHLHDLLEEASTLLREESQRKRDILIGLRFDAPKDLVMGDAPRIIHTILALGLNAREAMSEGGLLSITTSTPHPKELPAGLASGNYIRVDFSDTGTGMKKEIMENLFEPFFSTKIPEPGRGMSLAAIYGLMQAHGGLITAESTPGEGSCFSLFFPLD